MYSLNFPQITSFNQNVYEHAKECAKFFHDIEPCVNKDEANIPDKVILQDSSNWSRMNGARFTKGEHVVHKKDGDNQDAQFQEVLMQTQNIVQRNASKWKDGLDSVLGVFGVDSMREVNGCKGIRQHTECSSARCATPASKCTRSILSSRSNCQKTGEVNKIGYTKQFKTRRNLPSRDTFTPTNTAERIVETDTITMRTTSPNGCNKAKTYKKPKSHKKQIFKVFEKCIVKQEGSKEKISESSVDKHCLMNTSLLVNESSNTDSKRKLLNKKANTKIETAQTEIVLNAPTKTYFNKDVARTTSNGKGKEKMFADMECAGRACFLQNDLRSDDLVIELSKKAKQYGKRRNAMFETYSQTVITAGSSQKRVNNTYATKKIKKTSDLKETAGSKIVLDAISSSSNMSRDSVGFSSYYTAATKYLSMPKRDQRKRTKKQCSLKKDTFSSVMQMCCNSTLLHNDTAAKPQFGGLSPIQLPFICTATSVKVPNKQVAATNLFKTVTKPVTSIKRSLATVAANPTPKVATNDTIFPKHSTVIQRDIISPPSTLGIDNAVIAQKNEQTPKQSVEELKKYILVYTPQQKHLASNGYFNITQENLSITLGEKLATKFIRYNIGPRRFASTSKVYYCPPPSLPSDTGSEDDELERFGIYGELCESRQRTYDSK